MDDRIALESSPLKRTALSAIGWLSLSAGIIGVFVPVWPTTCFLLAAAACFARTSPRMDAWMTSNRLVGRLIRDYRERGTVDPRIRNGALLVLWSSLAATFVVVNSGPWLTAGMLIVGIAVTWHLCRLPGRDARRSRKNGGAPSSA